MDENKLKALAELAKSLKPKPIQPVFRILMMLNVFAGVCDDKCTRRSAKAGVRTGRKPEHIFQLPAGYPPQSDSPPQTLSNH